MASEYDHGGLEISPVSILRLISELEGSYQLTKWMAFDEDNATLDEMKKRYYKLYFKTVKMQKLNDSIPSHLKDEWKSYLDVCESFGIEPNVRRFLRYNELFPYK